MFFVSHVWNKKLQKKVRGISMELNSHMAVCCPPGSILNKYLFQWKI